MIPPMRTILALLCACLHVPVATTALGDEDFEGDRGARDGPQDALRGPLRPLARQAEGARADALHPREHDRGDAGGPLLPAVGRPPRRAAISASRWTCPATARSVGRTSPRGSPAGAIAAIAARTSWPTWSPGCAVLDHLIEVGLTDPGRVAAIGTSRGGFSALHFAAADPRVKCVAAFAPAIDLGALREFRGAEQAPMTRRLDLQSLAGDLAGRALWLVIGDRDERIGTDHVIHFARRVTAESLRKGRPASRRPPCRLRAERPHDPRRAHPSRPPSGFSGRLRHP